jgi:HPt (histidine-containing phosphotransfer) domain-containing protein
VVSKAGSEDETAPLDPAVLTALRQLCEPGNSDFLTEVIGLYLEDAPRYLKRAQEAVSTLDSESLKRAIHSLKGSSGHIGARHLAALCLDLEIEATQGRSENFGKKMGLIEAESVRVHEALLSELSKL